MSYPSSPFLLYNSCLVNSESIKLYIIMFFMSKQIRLLADMIENDNADKIQSVPEAIRCIIFNGALLTAHERICWWFT